MAGRGPAPKDPSKRARQNKDVVPLRTVEVRPVPQPELPVVYTPYGDTFEWPEVTQRWWQSWGEHPLSAGFTQADWDELMIAARLHADYWMGNVKAAAELRLRTAKFGTTPEDRARLRLQFVTADDAERKSQASKDRGTAADRVKGRRGPLRAV